MKHLYKVFTIITLLLLVMCLSLAVSAKVLDPARENGIAEKAGYKLDEMETSKEILDNGDVKIWYIDTTENPRAWMASRFPEMSDPESSEYKATYSYYFDVNNGCYSFVDVYLEETSIDGILKQRVCGGREGTKRAWYPIGDTDLNGEVNLADVLCLRQILAGLSSQKLFYYSTADLNQDKTMDLKDVLLLRRIIAKMDKIDLTISRDQIEKEFGWDLL